MIDGVRTLVRPRPLYPRKDDTAGAMAKIAEDPGDSQNFGRCK